MSVFFRGPDIPENRKIELDLEYGSESLTVDESLLYLKCPLISSVLDFQNAMSIEGNRSGAKRLSLPKIKLAAMEVVIDWMYTGVFALPYKYHSDDMTIPDTFYAACLLGLKGLAKDIFRVLEGDLLRSDGNAKIQNRKKLFKELRRVLDKISYPHSQVEVDTEELDRIYRACLWNTRLRIGNAT
ncbi:hypothetical protein TWF506_006035 [Arthrobotrys conoides]|uniref:BTB domain-containing protein n=1 Tax=Arthrobotrys conoides TaxID=74498 RepID=A0AAN8NLE1_9PEZI